MKMFGYNLPWVYANSSENNAPPKSVKSIENRNVADVLARPRYAVIDPATLHYPNHVLPVVPGNANVTCGASMVPYDHQPQWDRTAIDQAGPVRELFRQILHDNRVKHI